MLHVRRGDYLKVPIYQILESEYFENAIQIVLSNISTPIFYIFSDDLKWVSDNLVSLFIKNNINFHLINDTKIDIEDFYLMSKCKHAIISNSTFSWWAAWLGDSNKKLVIGPEKWFKIGVDNYNNFDIIPNRWIKI
jgi:hypothetical protein